LAAEEEAKRLEELQKQAARERMEQFEKAHERGFQAMKKIHLAQVRTSVTVSDGITEVGGAGLKARGCEGCYIRSLTHVTQV
jgi:hypothetical protein